LRGMRRRFGARWRSQASTVRIGVACTSPGQRVNTAASRPQHHVTKSGASGFLAVPPMVFALHAWLNNSLRAAVAAGQPWPPSTAQVWSTFAPRQVGLKGDGIAGATNGCLLPRQTAGELVLSFGHWHLPVARND
jgi:hypothetical protein